MSNDNLTNLTRRKVLGSLGALGAGAALGGAGTAAFFSDEETFQDNQLVAGSLDLKVDWEEHYYDGSAGSQYVEDYFTINEQNPVLQAGQVGFPDPEEPIAAVNAEMVEEFMAATAIEAFPDANDDRQQDDLTGFDFCVDGADTPQDMDPSAEGALRTMNEDTWDDEGESEKPLVSLGDVKPGDFGELTLSFHLCDNAGYVWMTGEKTGESENGLTEPEMQDPDEDQTLNESGDVVPKEAGADVGPELGDLVETVMWYDNNGNNLIDGEAGKVDIVMAVDYSGSLSADQYDSLVDGADAFFDALSGDIQLGTIHFGNDPVVDQHLTDLGSHPVPSTVLPGSAPPNSNRTHMAGAIDFANDMLDNDGRADAQQYIILATDGGPNYDNDDLTLPISGDTATYVGGVPNGSIEQSELDETAARATNAKSDGDILITVGIEGSGFNDFLRDRVATSQDYHYTATFANLQQIGAEIIAQVTNLDEIIFRGTLNEALAELGSDNGIPLDADLTTEFDELEDSADSPNRECFSPKNTHNVGFAWWLPLDHGNEVQTDSIEFDLGFYTEQCRHNDGAGLAEETTSPA